MVNGDGLKSVGRINLHWEDVDFWGGKKGTYEAYLA